MKIQRQYTDGKCTHVRVIHTGDSPQQNFSHRWAQAMVEGWMRRDGNQLLLLTDGEPLRYTIKREPGHYCKSTGEAIAMTSAAIAQLYAGYGRLSMLEAKAWLAAHGKAADDYEICTAYECELDAAQHAKFHAVHDAAGNAVAAYTLEA